MALMPRCTHKLIVCTLSQSPIDTWINPPFAFGYVLNQPATPTLRPSDKKAHITAAKAPPRQPLKVGTTSGWPVDRVVGLALADTVRGINSSRIGGL